MQMFISNEQNSWKTLGLLTLERATDGKIYSNILNIFVSF